MRHGIHELSGAGSLATGSLLEALPVLLVTTGFGCIGLWMILYTEDARRFMDSSLKKNDAYLNRKDSRPTPRYFPRLMGTILVIFTIGLALVLVISLPG
jgi:hypothetical protein